MLSLHSIAVRGIRRIKVNRERGLSAHLIQTQWLIHSLKPSSCVEYSFLPYASAQEVFLSDSDCLEILLFRRRREEESSNEDVRNVSVIPETPTKLKQHLHLQAVMLKLRAEV